MKLFYGKFPPVVVGTIEYLHTVEFCCYQATCATVYAFKLRPAAIYGKPSFFMGEAIQNCPYCGAELTQILTSEGEKK
jgi:hypothetical protein